MWRKQFRNMYLRYVLDLKYVNAGKSRCSKHDKRKEENGIWREHEMRKEIFGNASGILKKG